MLLLCFCFIAAFPVSVVAIALLLLMIVSMLFASVCLPLHLRYGIVGEDSQIPAHLEDPRHCSLACLQYAELYLVMLHGLGSSNSMEPRLADTDHDAMRCEAMRSDGTVTLPRGDAMRFDGCNTFPQCDAM